MHESALAQVELQVMYSSACSNRDTVQGVSLLDPAVVFSAETLSTTRTGEEDDDNGNKDKAGGILWAGRVRKRNGCRTQQLYVL